MNGAQALVQTLIDYGVEVVFGLPALQAAKKSMNKTLIVIALVVGIRSPPMHDKQQSSCTLFYDTVPSIVINKGASCLQSSPPSPQFPRSAWRRGCLFTMAG